MSSNFSKKCLRHTHTQNIQVVEDSRLTTGVLKIFKRCKTKITKKVHAMETNKFAVILPQNDQVGHTMKGNACQPAKYTIIQSPREPD